MPASHRGVGGVPAAPLPIQLPANVPGKTAEDGGKAWAPDTYMGKEDLSLTGHFK